MVSITEKIEEIRKQPENVRIRYVWGCVAASMFLIIIIWFFSISAMLKKDSPKPAADSIENLKTQLKDVNKQAPSIKEIEQKAATMEEGIRKTDNNVDNTELQYPLESETSEDVQQSSAYKEE